MKRIIFAGTIIIILLMHSIGYTQSARDTIPHKTVLYLSLGQMTPMTYDSTDLDDRFNVGTHLKTFVTDYFGLGVSIMYNGWVEDYYSNASLNVTNVFLDVLGYVR